LQKLLTGFAAGVMVAASFWSLLQPALDGFGGDGKAVVRFRRPSDFMIGIGFLLLLDVLNARIMHMDKQVEGPKSGLKTHDQADTGGHPPTTYPRVWR
jgi:ZIP family zinc transporter